MPAEALDAFLCEKYHCRPSELDQEDPSRILLHLTVWSVEAEAQAARAKNRAGR